MEFSFNFNLITIGSLSGVSSLIILCCKFFIKRYSFFRFARHKQNNKHLLPKVLYKAVFENCKFIEMNKYIAVDGHTGGNVWLKPYNCYPAIYGVSSFKNEDEAYIYKIDSFLYCMIKLKLFKTPKDIDFSVINERANAKINLIG